MILAARSVSGIAAALWLAGCASAPPLSRSTELVAIPDGFALAGQEEFGSCDTLGLPELPQLNAQLHAQNFELKAALARVEQAHALAGQAGATVLPRLDSQVSASRGNSTGAQFFATDGAAPVRDIYQGAITLSYEADLWGRVRAGADAASLDAEAQQALFVTSQLGLAASLAQNYLGLVAQRQLLDLLAAQRASSGRFLELTRLRYGQGQGAAQDIARQRQQLASLDARAASAAGIRVALDREVATLLGSTGALPQAAGRSALPAVPVITDPALPGHLVHARPDVGAALLRLAAADQRLAVALRNRLPSLSISASLLSVESVLTDLFADVLWQLGSELSTPLFDHGNRRYARDGARAASDEALNSYAQTLLVAINEVQLLVQQSKFTDSFAASVDAQLSDAQNVLTLTRDAYRQGFGDYLNVLTALQSLQSLEQQRVEARLQQFTNRITLCRALGHQVGYAQTMHKDAPDE